LDGPVPIRLLHVWFGLYLLELVNPCAAVVISDRDAIYTQSLTTLRITLKDSFKSLIQAGSEKRELKVFVRHT